MSWLLVFVGFSLLIILHEGGHFLAAKATGMRVERFFLFFGPTIWSFKRGETEYGIKSIPLGGYVKITGMNPEEDIPPEAESRAYHRQKVWKRIVVVAAGPAVNIFLAFVIFFSVFAAGHDVIAPTVGETRAGSPASRVLEPGDRIVAIDGHRFANLGVEDRLQKFGELVGAHKCAGKLVAGCAAAQPVQMTIRHHGALETISVRPKYDGQEKRMLIGFAYGHEAKEVGVGTAVDEAGSAVWKVTSGTAHVFSHLLEAKEREQVSGIVGTSDLAHQTIERSLEQTMILLAVVSLSLGLINLLPILPLDGGHILWALVEKLRRGRPVSMQVMERASIIGFALVAMLFFLGLSNDIGRITGEGFNVR
jgi:regulator of sigma E protease